MSYTIIEKGWEIDRFNIDEGRMYDRVAAHAPTKNKAKSKLLSMRETREMFLRNGEEITYLNIPVIECPECDLILYDGQQVKRYEIAELERKKEHSFKLADIISDEHISHVYIRKRGYFYCDNYCGYTEHKYNAGVYSKFDGFKHALGIVEIELVPIQVDEHNQLLLKHLADVAARLINQ